jgi:hypothetical protein
MVMNEVMVTNNTNAASRWICQSQSLYRQLHLNDKYLCISLICNQYSEGLGSLNARVLHTESARDTRPSE